MRTDIAICLATVFVCLSAAPALAQAPAASLESSGQMEASGGLLSDRIDPERTRQIGNERTRQYLLGAGLMAAGGGVGFTKNDWPIEEGVIGIAIALLGVSAFIEPLTWRDLDVRTSANGLTLAW